MIERQNGERQKKTIKFWVFLLSFLIFSSLFIKTLIGLKNSFFLSLSRANFLIETKDNMSYILSIEGKSGKIFLLDENKKSIQKDHFVPVFGNFFQNSSIEIGSKDGKKYISNLFWKAFWEKIETNLNKFDLAVLYFKSFMLESDKISVSKFNNSPGEEFKDSKLRGESLAIAVLNATNYSGFAQSTAELIRNAGGRVIKISDQDKREDDCIILVVDKKINYTQRWFEKVFGCRVVESSENTDRADLTLILGESYWKKLSF